LNSIVLLILNCELARFLGESSWEVFISKF